MTVDEIKHAVNSDMTVNWCNMGYTVVKDQFDKYFIKHSSGDCIGLTWKDGTTLNGEESEFFIRLGKKG